MGPFVPLAVAALLTIVCSSSVRGQTPPAAASHPNFSGTWTLNLTLSDDPLEARFDRTPSFGDQGRPPTRGYGGRGGFGGRRGGVGESPGTGDSGGANTVPNPTASALIHEAKT